MKMETQYLWRDTTYPIGKQRTGITWAPDAPPWRRPGHEPVLETAKQVMVRDQQCEWDYLYGVTGTCITSGRPVWPALLLRPKCCDEDPGYCPLAGPAVIYTVEQNGDVWTVTTRGNDAGRVVYEGPGPVYITPNDTVA